MNLFFDRARIGKIKDIEYCVCGGWKYHRFIESFCLLSKEVKIAK